MNKLLITRGADFCEYQEWIRFDIRSNNLNSNQWAALKVIASTEMTPYQSFEVSKDTSIEGLCSVIDLLNEYIRRIQKDE